MQIFLQPDYFRFVSVPVIIAMQPDCWRNFVDHHRLTFESPEPFLSSFQALNFSNIQNPMIEVVRRLQVL